MSKLIKFSRKWMFSIIAISALIMFALFLILNKRYFISNENSSINVFVEELEQEGFNVTLRDYPQSRSENFSYSQLPDIMLIDGEEVFVFQYNNHDKVIENIKVTNPSDMDSTYYSNDNIFLYRGDNKIITSMLKRKLNSAQ